MNWVPEGMKLHSGSLPAVMGFTPLEDFDDEQLREQEEKGKDENGLKDKGSKLATLQIGDRVVDDRDDEDVQGIVKGLDPTEVQWDGDEINGPEWLDEEDTEHLEKTSHDFEHGDQLRNMDTGEEFIAWMSDNGTVTRNDSDGVSVAPVNVEKASKLAVQDMMESELQVGDVVEFNLGGGSHPGQADEGEGEIVAFEGDWVIIETPNAERKIPGYELTKIGSKQANQFIKKDGPAEKPWAIHKHDDDSIISTHTTEEKAEEAFSGMMANKSGSRISRSTRIARLGAPAARPNTSTGLNGRSSGSGNAITSTRARV